MATENSINSSFHPGDNDQVSPVMIPYQPVNVNEDLTWVDQTNIQPGISMPNPIEKLSPGIPFPIPSDRLVSIDSLNQTINLDPENHNSSLKYLMSNDQDLSVVLTQYDKRSGKCQGCCKCGCCKQDTFEHPEKLIAGTVDNPLYDITSWEGSKSGDVANYLGFREQRNLEATEAELNKLKKTKIKKKHFLDYFCRFGYKSEAEALHWKKERSFASTYMAQKMKEKLMVDSFRDMWKKAHNLNEADTIFKNEKSDLDGNGIRKGWNNNDLASMADSQSTKVIGRAQLCPFEFVQTHRQVIRGNKKSTKLYLEHTATYNLEHRIYQCDNKGQPYYLQYRIRAVQDFPTAEQNYKEVQPEKVEGDNNDGKTAQKPQDMKGMGEVYFVILDGLLHLPISENSVLGSAVMQSGSNKMVIKFPREANEDDRIRLFSSLVMLENFMRSRSYRKKEEINCDIGCDCSCCYACKSLCTIM